MTTIGNQDGIAAAINRLRTLDPGGTKPNRNPDDLGTWGAWDKLERTLQILADDHDEQADDRPPNPVAPTVFECGVFVAGGAGSNETDPTGNGDSGGDYSGRPWTPEQACDAFKRSGYPCALVQLYREQGAAYMAAGRARGMRVGLWDAWPSADRARLALSFGPDAYCPQAETAQGADCIAAIEAAYAADPKLPLAIVTNMQPSRTLADFDERMHACNVTAMPEAYANENAEWSSDPRGFVDALVDECYSRGYVNVVPVLGCYWGWTVAQYGMQPDEAFYPYLAETMQHAELS